MGLFGYEFGIHDSESRATALVLTFVLVLVAVIVIADFLIGHHLNRLLPFHVPESGICMALGVALGGILKLAGSSDTNPLIHFSPTIFFLAFLPPIIFNEGYHLKQQFFFGYIKEILLFAVAGTCMSTAIMTLLIYYTPGRDPGSTLTVPEAASFGALISATDPVAVLAILGSLRVEPALFYLVFGESVLNDAVGLTIFNIAAKFVGIEYSDSAVVAGIADFIIIMTGSCIVGLLVPGLTTLMLKHADLRKHPVLEISAYVLMSYVPYLLAEIIGMSGIVAILTAGMAMRSYAHRNLSSHKTQDYAEFIWRCASFLADNSVFLYLGTTVFGLSGLRYELDIAFVGWALLSCLISRAVVVLGLSMVINLLVPYTSWNPISFQNQVVLWFAGLRGAVAFAAAIHFPDENGHSGLILTTTMAIILAFTFVAGPLTLPLIKAMKVRIAVRHTNARPPLMPGFIDWLTRFDDKYLDKFLIVECAQNGEPCEKYHLHGRYCPSAIHLNLPVHSGNSLPHNSRHSQSAQTSSRYNQPVSPSSRAISSMHRNSHLPSAYQNSTGAFLDAAVGATQNRTRSNYGSTDETPTGDSTCLDSSTRDDADGNVEFISMSDLVMMNSSIMSSGSSKDGPDANNELYNYGGPVSPRTFFSATSSSDRTTSASTTCVAANSRHDQAITSTANHNSRNFIDDTDSTATFAETDVDN